MREGGREGGGEERRGERRGGGWRGPLFFSPPISSRWEARGIEFEESGRDGREERGEAESRNGDKWVLNQSKKDRF